MVLYQQGEFEKADRLLDQAMHAFRQVDPGTLVGYLGWRGLVRLERGRMDDARACFAELEALLEQLPQGSLAGCPALNLLGVAAIRLGDRDRAVRCYQRLLANTRQHHWFLSDRVLGSLAAFNRQWSQAEAHFVVAAGLARRQGIRPELGLTLLESARMRLARGAPEDRAKALGELGEAIHLFSTLGMARAEADARGLLEGTSADRRGGAAARLPCGLTARQVEVLRLVAEGKPNREIADTLGVSEKTIINHLTAIFNRTGSDNRAAATAFAFRHNLI